MTTFFLQENECFQESLRNTERKFLSATRDRNFLLERLSAYEPVDTSTSDTEETAESSDDEHLRTSAKRYNLGVLYNNFYIFFKNDFKNNRYIIGILNIIMFASLLSFYDLLCNGVAC